jgi:hypothetical protein
MLFRIKIKETLPGETRERSVARGCPQRGTLPHSCEAWLKMNSYGGLNGNGCYALGYVLTSSAENSQILSHNFFRRLWVWNNSGVVKLRYQAIHKSFGTFINILVNRSLRLDLLAGHWTFLKVWDAKCLNIRAAKNFSMFIVVINVPNLLVLHSIPFCSILRTY